MRNLLFALLFGFTMIGCGGGEGDADTTAEDQTDQDEHDTFAGGDEDAVTGGGGADH